MKILSINLLQLLIEVNVENILSGKTMPNFLLLYFSLAQKMLISKTPEFQACSLKKL
jgi:hypothetical protein